MRTYLDRLLTWRRLRAYALVLVLLYVVAWVDVVVTGSPPLNSGGVPIAGDFIAFHAAARLVVSGHASQMYDHDAIVAVQDVLLDGRIPHFYDAYRNPAFFALVYAPLAPLDLLPTFAVWSSLSLICLGVSLRLLAVEVEWVRSRWRGLLVFVFAFAPVYFGLIDGENALVSLLLYVLIARSLGREQDVLAGMWAGLGLFKPQLFFLFPLVFVVSGRWRALAAYAVTGVALALVSFALVGADGLQAWGRILLDAEGGNATVNGWRMASAKSFFDALLPGASTLTLALYIAVAVALVAGLVQTWRARQVPFSIAWAFTSLVAVLVDPHLVDYDLTVLVAAGIIAAPLVRQFAYLVIPLYLVALFRAQIPLGDGTLQLTPPLLVACALLVFREIRQQQPVTNTRQPSLVSSANGNAALVAPR